MADERDDPRLRPRALRQLCARRHAVLERVGCLGEARRHGVEVQMESLRALLLGGIAFETPAAGQPRSRSADNHVFPLFADRDDGQCRVLHAARSRWSRYFPGSVSGLGAGLGGHRAWPQGRPRDWTFGLPTTRPRTAILAPVRYRGRAGAHRRRRQPVFNDAPRGGRCAAASGVCARACRAPT